MNFKGTVGQFNQFKTEYSWRPEILSNDMFVLHMNTEENKFIMVLSSIELLSVLISQSEKSNQPSFFHTDATYKLMSDGFLLLTMSNENPNHASSLIAIAITLHENEEAYHTFFNSIRGFLETNLNFKWEPLYCLSDGAEAIVGALRKNFPNCKHLLCFFHLKKAVKRYVRSIKSIEEKKKILDLEPLILYSIDLLHKTKKHSDFIWLWSLVRKEWENKMKVSQTFVDYFQRQYINSNSSWLVGAAFIGLFIH
jgi:hypothetical protein